MGVVTVDGAGSMLSTSQLLNVGVGGATAQVNIINGGEVSGFDGDIGVGRVGVDDAGTVGVVTVDGAGSLWHLTNSVTVGSVFEDSFGTLNITNGAMVSIDQGLGVATNASDVVTGQVNIHTGGVLRVGGVFAQQGTFNLLGGTVILGGNRTFDGVGVGDEDSLLSTLGGVFATGQKLVVEGQLSVLTPMQIDGGGLSAASIVNLGGVDFKRGFLELTAVDIDVALSGPFGATVSLPADRHLNIVQAVRVAGEGRIELSGGRLGAGVLENDGLVVGDGRIDGVLDNAVGGQVRVDIGQSMLITGAGNVNDGDINVLGATVEFEQELTNSSTGRISGRGTVIVDGGLTNQGELFFSGGFTDVFGDVTVTGGARVEVTGESVVTFHHDVHNDGVVDTSGGSVTVFRGAVTGAGDFINEGTVVFEGEFSPGAVLVEGDVELRAGAVLRLGLGGMVRGAGCGVRGAGCGVRGAEYDFVHIHGALRAGGVLEVALIDGFMPEAGGVFEVFGFGAVSGGFDQVVLPGLGHGLSFDASGLLSDGALVVVPEPGGVTMAIATVAVWGMRRQTH